MLEPGRRCRLLSLHNQNILFSLYVSSVRVRCIMLETKHEELHLSVVTVVVRCTWQSQYSASNCKIFYCYFVAPQKSAHILTRNRGTRIKKAGKLYYICISVLVCILMQHLSRSAVLMDDQFCISREGLKKKRGERVREISMAEGAFLPALGCQRSDYSQPCWAILASNFA